jgi:hypothetical protein
MRQVREDLQSHSEEMAQRVRSQLDWRQIVARHPLITLGAAAAAAAGYLLAPRRVHYMNVDDKAIKATVEKAVGQAQSAAPASMASGLAAGIASMLIAAVVREGVSVASQFVRSYFDSHAGDAPRSMDQNETLKKD